MQGTIIIADLLAEEAARKAQKYPPPTQRPKTHAQQIWEAQREAEAVADWLHRQRVGSYSMAVAHYASCKGDRTEQAKVWQMWGDTLTEAFAYRKQQRRILERERLEQLEAREAKRKPPIPRWRHAARAVWRGLLREV